MLDRASCGLVDKEFKRILLSNTAMWLNMLDKNANVILWNKAAEIISGYSEEEVLAIADIWALLYPNEKYRKFVYDKAVEVIEKEGVLTDFETTICCKDGSSKVLSWNTHRMMGECGDVIGSIALAIDVTEIKGNEKKNQKLVLDLEQNNIDKSRFLAATSHDLRQPLHSLGLFLSVLKSKLTNEEQHVFLDKASQSQEILSNQLNALMDLAQLDSDAVMVQPKFIFLDDFVIKVVEEFKLFAEQKNIILKMKLQKSVVYYDPIILARIIRNLISNVLEHCPGSTLLILLKRRNSGVVELCFIDNGPGISSENQQDIFSEFFQLNNPERDRNKGIGLGLAIVKRLVDMLGVSIRLKSRIGRGSSFKIMLKEKVLESPLENQPLLESFKSDKLFDVSGRFVVVLDDDESVLSAMREILTLWGCEVLISNKYSDLKAVIENNGYRKPDLLMVDYRLNEGMDGIQVIKAVRDYFNASIPAVIISGDVTLGLEEKVDISKVDVVYKPVSEKVLKGVLYRSLV